MDQPAAKSGFKATKIGGFDTTQIFGCIMVYIKPPRVVFVCRQTCRCGSCEVLAPIDFASEGRAEPPILYTTCFDAMSRGCHGFDRPTMIGGCDIYER
jgi:hypothetical protein